METAAALLDRASAAHQAGRLAEAEQGYLKILEMRPDFVPAHFNLAHILLAQGKMRGAITHYEAALRLDPQNFRAFNNLGNMYRAEGDPKEAVRIYRRALEIKPDYPEAFTNLGTALRDLGQYDEALESYKQGLGFKPNFEAAEINLGTLLQRLGRYREAVALYDEILRRAPNSKEAQWNKAMALLALGDYVEGWKLHESGLGDGSKRGPAWIEKRWDGSPFPGKRLLIRSEQGLGDSLQFVRYAALCKERGGQVLLQCSKPLARLLRNCPFIDAVVADPQDSDFDFQIAMMSLPYIFGTTLETIPAKIPYLFVDDATQEKWAPIFFGAAGFKIGLVWAGSPREIGIDARLMDERRSIDLEMLKPLFACKDVGFYSLQIGKAVGEIAANDLGGRLIDYTNGIEDFLDTAAIVENLDLVISVDTSVVHLAGGLGKPVWVLSRFDACWRWLQNREISPWYPNARVFGQPVLGDWNSVVKNVCDAFGRELARKAPNVLK